jgi:hypothetical protein
MGRTMVEAADRVKVLNRLRKMPQSGASNRGAECVT